MLVKLLYYIILVNSNSCHQAKKAQSTLDMHTSSHPTVSLNHIFELFDCLIKPVLTYGCAVWGSGNIADIEKCHLQFMKQTLKVKMTTNSCVVYAETGRFPLCVFINMCMIKHSLKILNMNVKQLVHVAHREMFQHQEQHAWIRHIKDLLCCHGFGNIWNQGRI